MKLRVVARARWEIMACCTPRGDCPVMEGLDDPAGLAAGDHMKMLALLLFTAHNGPPRNREKSNDLGDGLCEFKTKYLRIPYFFDEGRVILCTHLFKKERGKTPPAEIERANSVRRRYFEDKQKGENEVSK